MAVCGGQRQGYGALASYPALLTERDLAEEDGAKAAHYAGKSLISSPTTVPPQLVEAGAAASRCASLVWPVARAMEARHCRNAMRQARGRTLVAVTQAAHATINPTMMYCSMFILLEACG